MKLINKFIAIFFICGALFSDTVIQDLGADYMFTVTYHDTGVHETGLTIPLSIKRVSDGKWFDFSDDTFKTSGWVSKTVNLTEDATNHQYFYTWLDQGGDTTRNEYIFHVECTGEFISNETVIYEDLSTSIAAIKNRVNALNP